MLHEPLRGPLRYLIEVDEQLAGREGEIIEVGLKGPKPKRGRGARYCNLLDQTKTGSYGPYRDPTDTAEEYSERVLDPSGAGWKRLLTEQCESAIAAGFDLIEWDNPDSYSLEDVIAAVDLAREHGLDVLAKNPLLMEEDPTSYVAHAAVVGVVVERGAGSPGDMDRLRKSAGKPDLPVYFVAFRKGEKDGRAWAGNTARLVKPFKNMWVTVSLDGEYTSSTDVR